LTRLDQIRTAESKLLLQTYERNPILFVRGEGVHLIDEGGAKYLDLLSGIGVNALGYGHPAIERAIVNQSRALIHTSNLFYHEGQAELAMRLTERTGMDRVHTLDCYEARESRSGRSFWRLSKAFTDAPTGRCRPRTRRSTASRLRRAYRAWSL
jgi:acetylornithine/succinyldiaminopimelate/putrescine aminotransferase